MSAAPNAIVAFVNFAPANPVVAATTNIRNMQGLTAGAVVVVGAPAWIAAGQYQFQIGGEFARTELSITCGASTAVAGGAATDRKVTVLMTAPVAGSGVTIGNIQIRDDAGTLVDTTANVEVTIRRLPVKQN